MSGASGASHDILLIVVAAIFILFAVGLVAPEPAVTPIVIP